MMMNGKPYIPALTPAAIDRRKNWDYKAILYLHGPRSQLGSLIIAILGRIQHPPAFMPIMPVSSIEDIGGMKITAEGACLVQFKASAAAEWREECIYPTVQQMTDVFRGLADALKLDDAQTIAMFDAVKKFVRVDERKQDTNLFS